MKSSLKKLVRHNVMLWSRMICNKHCKDIYRAKIASERSFVIKKDEDFLLDQFGMTLIMRPFNSATVNDHMVFGFDFKESNESLYNNRRVVDNIRSLDYYVIAIRSDNVDKATKYASFETSAGILDAEKMNWIRFPRRLPIESLIKNQEFDYYNLKKAL